MDLIFIYGPPASGKLTIAKKLSALTNFPIFHNHLTYDLIHSVFKGIDTGDFNHHLRLEVFKQAVKSNLPGLIFTFVYGYGLDDDFAKSVVEIISSTSGRVCFVQLTCPRSVLHQRVSNQSRFQYRKITTPDDLDRMINKYEITTTLPETIGRSLVIDSSRLTPVESAHKIKLNFNL